MLPMITPFWHYLGQPLDLDLWIDHYNNERTHQGKVCKGKTPMQALEDGKAIWKEKFIDQT